MSIFSSKWNSCERNNFSVSFSNSSGLPVKTEGLGTFCRYVQNSGEQPLSRKCEVDSMDLIFVQSDFSLFVGWKQLVEVNPSDLWRSADQ